MVRIDESMDRYLGRCLKNWIVRQPLPPDRRKELMARAAGQPKRRPKLERLSPSELERLLPGQWRGPITQSRGWLYNLTLNLRMVT